MTTPVDVAAASEIIGAPGSRFVEFRLSPGMEVQAEGGALLYTMGNDKTLVRGKTTIKGSVGNAIGRYMAGATFFFNTFSVPALPASSPASVMGGLWGAPKVAPARATVAFGSSLPGDVMCMRLEPGGKGKILSRHSLLATTRNVDVSFGFRALGILGIGQEEGIMLPTAMNSSSEPGFVWVASYGTFREVKVPKGESLLVNNGLFLACDHDMAYDLTLMGDGYVSSFFGGEGLGMKYTATNDDCRVWIQSKNMNALIDTVARAAGPPAATPAETVENTIVKAGVNSMLGSLGIDVKGGGRKKSSSKARPKAKA